MVKALNDPQSFELLHKHRKHFANQVLRKVYRGIFGPAFCCISTVTMNLF